MYFFANAAAGYHLMIVKIAQRQKLHSNPAATKARLEYGGLWSSMKKKTKYYDKPHVYALKIIIAEVTTSAISQQTFAMTGNIPDFWYK